jgi:hypothetical protein
MTKLLVCGLVLVIGCSVPPEDLPVKTSALACGSTPKQLPFGHSVRILSFNTELLSGVFSLPTVYDAGETLARAKQIAKVVNAGKFDVIGFNEVWEEPNGKDTLVEQLCPTYPNFVKSVDGASLPEDSGLMVFSKLPFLDLPDPAFVSDDSESSLGDNSNRIAFTKFDDCDDYDCLASKGAVMVRVALASGRPLSFVTSHMQADDGDANEEIRIKQMRQIRGQCQDFVTSLPNLITTTLGLSLAPGAGLCAWPNTEWLAIAGDHNVHGEGAVRSSVHPGTSGGDMLGHPQWEEQIGAASGAFSLNGWTLFDPWAETTSPRDIGFSHIHDTRLDYILTGRRTLPVPGSPPEMCVQYVWNPPELDGISDHRPVAADLNQTAAQCNPRLAYMLQPTDLNVPGKVKGGKALPRTIQFAGNMQWFRIPEPGTYAFSAGALAFEVFAEDNLSIPLGGAHVVGTDTIGSCSFVQGGWACPNISASEFVLAKPGYVRVFSTNRGFTGNYTFTAYRYTCKSPSEACVALPHSPVAFKFPPGMPLNPEDAAWFQIDIRDQADSGAFQALRFHADNTSSAAWIAPELKVFDSAGTAELGAIDGTAISGQLVETTPGGNSRVLRTGAARINQRVFLRVRRGDVSKKLELAAGWQTNLMLVGALGPAGATLVCEDETNPEHGSDEIRMRVRVDGTWKDAGSASYDCDNGAIPKGWTSKIGIVRAVNDVRIRVIEEDDFLAFGDDVAGSISVDFLPVDSVISGAGDHEINWWFSGGHYRFYFQGGKWRE